MKGKVAIFNDLFDIAARIKSIDDGYFVMYNVGSKKFEIHNCRCSQSLQLVLPYETLDIRAVQHTQRTRVENLNKMASEMDKYNAELDKQKSAAILDEAQYKTKKITEYLSSGGVEIPPYDSI